jgi:very-short-patch-repair endonuclease
VHVVVLGRGRSGRPGIRVHETTFLEPRDVRRRHGLPITSPARTLLDLADVLPTRRLERALDEAVGRRLARRSQLEDVVARANGRRGAKRLARLLAGAGTTRTRADSEERLLDLLRRAQLPAPILNHPLHGYEADFYWPDHGLVLEMDSWDWHSGRRAFERDRRKSAVLTAAGLRVTHSTWTQAESEPLAVVARVAQALAAR